MRAGHGRIAEVVANGVPRLAAVVGALHHLAVPAGRLRRIDAVGIGRRALEVVHLPATEERPVDLPVLARAVGAQHERTLARAAQNPYTAHVVASRGGGASVRAAVIPRAISAIALMPAPTSRFIGPPGAKNPSLPKMVKVSISCSRTAIAVTMPSHRGKAVRPASTATVTGASMVMIAPVSTGPQ